MRVTLELIRIILIIGIIGAILGAFIQTVYFSIGVNVDRFGWIAFLAIIILLFVLYRNKLQFGGWYNGKGKVKLSKKVTNFLVFFATSLLIILPFVSYYFQ
ncbi:hypothetical protein [Gottfriedia luciferensis]|uniref:hypothetical protein n=1 Tax=Gottfriedia luciferensis TaxID=178774 RepID=UPI000B44FC9B|nr:hypothetical protein [Gottfriedia luciferensis]